MSTEKNIAIVLGCLALIGAAAAVGLGSGGTTNPLQNPKAQERFNASDKKQLDLRSQLTTKIDSCQSLLDNLPAIQKLTVQLTALPDDLAKGNSKEQIDALRAATQPIVADLQQLTGAVDSCRGTKKTSIDILVIWQRVQDMAETLLQSDIFGKSLGGFVNGNGENEDTGVTPVDYDTAAPGFDGVPILLQYAYKNVAYPLAGSTSSNSNISTSGCGIVAAAMVLQFYKIPDSDVPTLAKYALDNNFRGSGAPGDQGTRYNFFSAIAKKNGLTYVNLGDGHSDAIWKQIMDALAAHHPVIVSGSGTKPASPFTPASGHFVVLTGIAADGKINVNDSAPKGGQRSYSVSVIRSGIHSARIMYKP